MEPSFSGSRARLSDESVGQAGFAGHPANPALSVSDESAISERLRPRVTILGEPSSARRVDVLIEAKEVRRVVASLQREQPLIVRTEARAHHRLALFLEAGKVQVAAAVGVRLHGGNELAG